MSAAAIQKTLRALANPDIAAHSQRFFKTGKGEYGEGDHFLGLRVPVLRAQVKEYQHVSLAVVGKTLKSKYHEERLFALYLLVRKFALAKNDEETQREIYTFYLKYTAHINNWDLVDSSAYQIVGGYLLNKSRKPLYQLAQSESMWERRIAIITCFQFIRHNDFVDTLKLAEILLHDQEDLMHKAVGWMLRELGKRDQKLEQCFLDKFYATMPRTMLRYAIEKFPEALRQQYLKGTR